MYGSVESLVFCDSFCSDGGESGILLSIVVLTGILILLHIYNQLSIFLGRLKTVRGKYSEKENKKECVY